LVKLFKEQTMPQFSDDLYLGPAQTFMGVGNNPVNATFTGSIATTTLTVTAMLSGDPLYIGQFITGSSVTAGSYITAFVTGSGTTFTAAMVGKPFKAAGHSVWYLVSAFTSTTQITITDDVADPVYGILPAIT
jgi:hypothetical protein